MNSIRLKLSMLSAALAIGLLSSGSFAAETVTYTYDAKGRLVKVERTGGPNNAKKTEYEHDKADNRKRVKISGPA